MQPNFLSIGAAKCATSTISALIGQHPDVFMVSKEVSFFSDDEIYAKGFDWYESLFDNAGGVKMRGEGSNRYTMKEVFPNAVSRIISYTTDLKLIYIVRNPIARIASHWIEKRSHGGEDVHYDFNKAVRINREWLVDSSNYWQQINVFRSHFSDERIHIIFYEDFKTDQGTVMRRCFEFLNVDPDVPLVEPNIHLNPSTGKQVPINFLSRLRSYSLYRYGVEIIPKPWRDPLRKRFLFKEVKGRPQWSLEAREWVADVLETDTRRFLEYYGKPKDFWKLRDVGY
ncbi:MAG TPA: hypothetical protein DDZ80_04595 [Cyanobacteria bacterium UBA8803]|nr:hypothetical protein [Cyanobacteria bacterium UBA9273]HBL57838.1 hypothetical protein [Cyanobacteria bacterium UBA8803]